MTEIFLDKQVFKETYVPEKIIHRDAPISKIQHILADFQRDTTPSPMLVIGDLGTGKTAALRSICRNPPAGVKAVFVSCNEANTQTRIFRVVLEQLGVTVKSGFPGDYYLRLFKAALPPHLILVLDEVDRLIEHKGSEYVELFYTLTRTIFSSKIAIIMLTNQFSLEAFLKHELDPKVRDTLPFERIEFPDYMASELNDILQDRARVGFKPGTYDAGTMAQIARIVYVEGLRARGLMKLAWRVGELAEANNHEKITEEDVSVASVELLHGRGMEVISRLPPNLRAILGNVLLKSPTIEDAYDSFKLTPLAHDASKGMFYGYLKELETFGVLEKKTISLGYKRGVIVRLSVPNEMINLVANSLKDALSIRNEFPSTTTPTATNEFPCNTTTTTTYVSKE